LQGRCRRFDSGWLHVKRLVRIVAVVALGAALAGRIPFEWVGAPLLGLLIYQVGVASLGSLRRGAGHIPDGPPAPVDPRDERVTYLCGGCGAELLLLVRGAAVPPRHCGERMHERVEVPAQR
jgi:DNA-directed RNA polymerase subunit RPC12/RpoP